MDDQMILAATTPATGTPPPPADVTEARRQAIMKEADYWNDGAKTKALRDEMAALLAGGEQTRDAAAQVSPVEDRIKRANANPALWDQRHKDHEAARRELREAVAAGATPEEDRAFADAPLQEQRKTFGLGDPELPKSWLQKYDAEYSGHEQDFVVAAKRAGLDSTTVRDLRDIGVRLAIEADGRPVTEEAWASVEKKFVGRLSKEQFAELKRWWRTSVEGAA